MKSPTGNNVARSVAMLLALMLALLVPQGGAFAQDRPAFSQAQLEQMLAPIALYPDPLLSQILMASTYPLEVVEAARWSRSHPNLSGEDAVRAAVHENWDPSVKSLLAFPHVLARMDEDLQWLQTLGDAFLAQEPQVMDAVQNLRRRAQVAGNLRSDERQRIVETGPILVVQPADPQIIHVPYYDPRVVYGPWWWPHYSPVYWRPFPGYGAWPGIVSGFYWGPSIRISIGYFFGGFDWSHRHVRVVHSNFHHYGAARHGVIIHHDRPPGAWHHDPVHRRGVAYRVPEVRRQYADHATRPDGGRRPDREDARRQIQQHAPSQPGSNRHGESRNDLRGAAVQPVRDTPVQPAIQRVATTQAHSGAHPANPRGDRRDHAKDLERGDRRVPAERRQSTQTATQGAIPATGALPHAQGNRSNAIPARGDQAGHSARPGAGETAREPRSAPPPRHEAQREAGRPKGAQGAPEARPGQGWPRSASADSALQQTRQQR